MKTARQVFRDNLLQHMEDADMIGAELSMRLNHDRKTVSNYTSGKYLPRAQEMWMIARILGTTMDALMEGYTEEAYYESFETKEERNGNEGSDSRGEETAKSTEPEIQKANSKGHEPGLHPDAGLGNAGSDLRCAMVHGG